MTYSANLSSEGINSQYLAVMKPRRLTSTSWTLVGGTIYKNAFDYGQVVAIDYDDDVKTQASSSALSDGDWYYDVSGGMIYIDVGVDPSTHDVIATYEIYVGTFDAHHNRIPDDDTSRVVYYEPVIVRSPSISSTSSDVIFGFLPTQSTQISLSNATHILEKHIYDSSFHLADIDVYHWLGDLTVDNIKLVFRGVSKSVTYSDDSVVFNLLDRTSIFDTEYRNPTGVSFYNFTRFPDLDPSFENRVIRRVFGVVSGFVPVNIDHQETEPTTSDNRTWICLSDHLNLGSVSTSVPASPVSTSTRTYVASADGLRVGDVVWVDSASGPGFDEYPIITVVNKTGDHYIEHATIANVAATASIVKRSFVGSVTIIKENKVEIARYGRDYTEYTDSTNKVAGFTFSTSMEANLGFVDPLEPYDGIYATVYGQTNQVTLGGSAFGGDSAETGTLTDPVVILFGIIKELGLAETDIDTAAFVSAQLAKDDDVGFSVPIFSSDDFPTYKDLINRINQTLLTKVFMGDDGRWTVAVTGPIGSVTKIIEDDEILNNTFRYNFDYQDLISNVIVQYGQREYSEKHNIGQDNFSRETSTSTIATRLHKIERQRSFTSLHFLAADAQRLADRIRYIVGDRGGSAEFQTKNRFFDTELGDVIRIARTRLPGFDYDSATDRSREFIVLSTDKSLTEISMTLSDQKGIEENSGSW